MSTAALLLAVISITMNLCLIVFQIVWALTR